MLTNTGSCVRSGHALHILAIGTRPVSAGHGPTGGVGLDGHVRGPDGHEHPPSGSSLNNTTLREVVTTTSLGSGGSLRIQLSNAGSLVPVTFDDVTAGAQSSGEATVAAPAAVKFGGSTSVTIPARAVTELRDS